MLIFGIALAVAAVPEALPAVVTISLAIGVQRMVKRHALMRRLPAVETLGMHLGHLLGQDRHPDQGRDDRARPCSSPARLLEVTGAGYEPARVVPRGTGRRSSRPTRCAALLTAATLASDARIVHDAADGRWRVKGDPTEGALVVAAGKAGLHKAELDARWPRVGEIPFTSETKRMTTLHAGPEGDVACAKGAPEVILDSCTHQWTPSGAAPLDAAGREAVRGRRPRHGRARAARPGRGVEAGRPPRGRRARHDLARTGRHDRSAAARGAGSHPHVRAGRHPRGHDHRGPSRSRPQAVARELGLLTDGRVVTGAELEAMSDEDFEREVEGIQVYARVSPAHKLRVVTAWQKRGHIVAMTGDGVNDAPALKKADIGIAMGITGTDVTREAAAMTLTDDNFASIVAAVEEGRGIFGNIKKYLMYLLSSNVGEIGLMAGAALTGLPLPLSAVQILYVNLATDGFPALALAVDPPDPDIMRRSRATRGSGIFTRPVVALMAVGGIWSALANLGLFTWALRSGRSTSEAMTMTFVSLVVIQFFKAYNFRSDRQSLLVRPFANMWLNLAVLTGLMMLAMVVHLPVLQDPFGTYSLTARDWAIIVAVAFSVVPVLEVAKLLLRRRVSEDSL